MKERWDNHKSHIKRNHKTCEIDTHCIENPCHKLDSSSLKTYDDQLKCQLKIMAIEEVTRPPTAKTTDEKLIILEAREDFWQARLKRKSIFGDLNKRSSHRK